MKPSNVDNYSVLLVYLIGILGNAVYTGLGFGRISTGYNPTKQPRRGDLRVNSSLSKPLMRTCLSNRQSGASWTERRVAQQDQSLCMT